jgi:hypothetical protein
MTLHISIRAFCKKSCPGRAAGSMADLSQMVRQLRTDEPKMSTMLGFGDFGRNFEMSFLSHLVELSVET